MMCVFLYSLSLGPTTWVYTSEILPPKGVGMATTVNWLMTYLVAKVSPILFKSPIGSSGAFLIFAVCTFFVPSVDDNHK